MKYVNFAMKEESYGKYSVLLSPELENASEEEVKEWLDSGNADGIEYVKHLDTESVDLALDYLFEIQEC